MQGNNIQPETTAIRDKKHTFPTVFIGVPYLNIETLRTLLQQG
jgi:hypothetical protein